MSYSPNLGRWLQEDPIGFEAGDANLYRYVGNNPPNARDPMGLQTIVDIPWPLPWYLKPEVPVPGAVAIGSPFKAWIKFYGGSPEQREMLRQRTLEAGLRMRKALYALENCFCEIEKRYKNTIPISILFKDNNRDFYISRLQKVMRTLNNAGAVIEMEIEATEQKGFGRDGQIAYVWPWGFRIHFQPIFWDKPEEDQIDTVYHELGRVFGGITGSTDVKSGLSTNNIYNWDRISATLSERFEALCGKKEP